MHLARVVEAGGRSSGSAVKLRVGTEPAPTLSLAHVASVTRLPATAGAEPPSPLTFRIY